MILQCACAHETQDRWYGQRMRVHNQLGKEKKHLWRCTVCRRERGAS